MAQKLIGVVRNLDCARLTGVVNLDPLVAHNRSNYDPMWEFGFEYPNDLLLVRDVNNIGTQRWIRQREPDIIIQAGWSQIFDEEVLRIPRLYCLGLHASPLPQGRGAAILNWKLIEGGGPWGISLFVMEAKTDTGAIFDFEPFELELRDDVRMAYLKADRAAVRMVARTLPRIAAGTVIMQPQIASKATRYYKRRPEDGRLILSSPARQCLDFIRALTHPYPGAFVETRYGRLIVWRAIRGEVPVGGFTPTTAGTVLAIERGRGLLVAVGQGEAIWFTEVTPPNDVITWCDLWAVEVGLCLGHRLLD